jgi:hypothetical protein
MLRYIIFKYFSEIESYQQVMNNSGCKTKLSKSLIFYNFLTE